MESLRFGINRGFRLWLRLRLGFGLRFRFGLRLRLGFWFRFGLRFRLRSGSLGLLRCDWIAMSVEIDMSYHSRSVGFGSRLRLCRLFRRFLG